MLIHRLRRNRKSEVVRNLIQEIHLQASQLIYPLFILEGSTPRVPVKSMPGIDRLSLETLLSEVEQCCTLGLNSFALFPVIDKDKKNEEGLEALNPEGIMQKAIRVLKETFPHICLIGDVALDPYTSHGHDGILDSKGDVDNEKTVAVLSKMALIQAEAGVDMVAPSDMMDGRVYAIRQQLDREAFFQTNILAYSAKYASVFYGPFREALQSSLKKGDKKSYQLNPANSREAVLEAMIDEKEGADILLVKPALPYLDIIAKLKEISPLPIAAFQVSGEYSALKAASKEGWLDFEKGMMESLLCIKRAGADMIFTYAAPLVAKSLTTFFRG